MSVVRHLLFASSSVYLGLTKNLVIFRIKRLAEERDDLQDQVRRLKLDLEEEKNCNQKLERSTPFSPEEADWESKRLIDDYKFKLQKCEQDINTLQTNVSFSKKIGGGGAILKNFEIL